MTSSPRAQTKTKALAQAPDQTARAPQQDRSKASFKRMQAAARALMVARSSEDFTLTEVSKRGKVSIGSIYLRFESKDTLVRSILIQALEDLTHSEDSMLEQLLNECSSLQEFVPKYVEAYAEILSVNAALLRLAMMRAEHDPLIAEPGKVAAFNAVAKTRAALLHYADDFGGSDHETRANCTYNVIFATLARQFSLGAPRESATEFNLKVLKEELGKMCLAYLTAN